MNANYVKDLNFPELFPSKTSEIYIFKVNFLDQKRIKSFLDYCIVASISPSCSEAHAGLFRLLMKGIFNAYVL